MNTCGYLSTPTSLIAFEQNLFLSSLEFLDVNTSNRKSVIGQMLRVKISPISRNLRAFVWMIIHSTESLRTLATVGDGDLEEYLSASLILLVKTKIGISFPAIYSRESLVEWCGLSFLGYLVFVKTRRDKGPEQLHSTLLFVICPSLYLFDGFLPLISEDRRA